MTKTSHFKRIRGSCLQPTEIGIERSMAEFDSNCFLGRSALNVLVSRKLFVFILIEYEKYAD